MKTEREVKPSTIDWLSFTVNHNNDTIPVGLRNLPPNVRIFSLIYEILINALFKDKSPQVGNQCFPYPCMSCTKICE